MNRFVFFVALALIASCSSQPVYTEAPINSEHVVIDTKSIKQDIPQFFTYRHAGRKISFFVVKHNNEISSFFDACHKCYPQKRGFRSEGPYIICRECNERYPLSEIKEGIGSCYPIKLEGAVDGNLYKIPLNKLTEKAGFF